MRYAISLSQVDPFKSLTSFWRLEIHMAKSPLKRLRTPSSQLQY